MSRDWQQTIADYKYYALGGVYALATGFFFYRVRRQPYSQSMKIEQYESIFKATTLSTVLAGVGMNSGFDRYRNRDDRGDKIDKTH